MEGLLTWIPNGDAGTRATVAHIVQFAHRGSIVPLVREVTARLVLGVERAAHARVIRDWVGDHTEFLPDPAGAEALHDPGWVLSRVLTAGLVQLDCDDVALLTAAMGLSIGLRARLVVVAFGSPNNPYQHIWTELGGPGGWLPVDPTRPAQAFGALPIARSFIVEV